MKYNVSHLIGAFFAIPVALIVGFVSMNFFMLDQWIDWLLVGTSYIGAYIPIQLRTSKQYLDEIGLTRRDFKYVRKQLNIANPKIKELMRQYTKIRSISDFKNVNDINKLARTIYKTVQKQPRKFFKVDSFFFSHLDNTVNLIDQYMTLSRMPHKTPEEMNQLHKARITLEELKRTLQADLRALTSSDYQQMSVEVDLAKINQEQLPYEGKVEIPIYSQGQTEGYFVKDEYENKPYKEEQVKVPVLNRSKDKERIEIHDR